MIAERARVGADVGARGVPGPVANAGAERVRRWPPVESAVPASAVRPPLARVSRGAGIRHEAKAADLGAEMERCAPHAARTTVMGTLGAGREVVGEVEGGGPRSGYRDPPSRATAPPRLAHRLEEVGALRRSRKRRDGHRTSWRLKASA